MTDLIASGAEGSEQFNVLAVPIGELIIGTVAFLIVFFVLQKRFVAGLTLGSTKG